MNGLPYYKAYPRDFIEGTIGMPLELKGAYRVLLDLIYMQDGALPDDPHYISGQLGCSVRKWKTIRQSLVAAKKIEEQNGFISQKRARRELEITRKYQETQAENRRGSNKNKDLEKPPSNHTEPEPDNTEPNGSDGVAVIADATKDAIWKRGVPYLVESGVPDRQARSAIGKWIRDAGAQRLYDALAQSKASGTGDPIPYITKILQPEPEPVDVLAMVRERRARGEA